VEEKNFKIFTYKLLSKFGRDQNKLNRLMLLFLFGRVCVVCHFKKFLLLKTEIKISFLTEHHNPNSKTNCPFKLNGKCGGTLAHAFYPGVGQICGDIHFDK